MNKRLDVFLAENGFAKSRQKAKELIMSGSVFVNGRPCEKPSFEVDDKAKIEIKGEVNPFVSRGGLKLKKAIEVFNINLEGKTAADIGASTGGFTDCMLQNGVKRVYAVDVGTAQLDGKLKADGRVISLENTDIREIDKGKIPCQTDFIAADVSFISLSLIIPHIYELLKESGECVLLIKPQFELNKGDIGKNGVVKDLKLHEKAIANVLNAVKNAGFAVKGLDFSPITGSEGNIEFLLYAVKENKENINIDIKSIVNAAHNNFKGGKTSD